MLVFSENLRTHEMDLCNHDNGKEASHRKFYEEHFVRNKTKWQIPIQKQHTPNFPKNEHFLALDPKLVTN